MVLDFTVALTFTPGPEVGGCPANSLLLDPHGALDLAFALSLRSLLGLNKGPVAGFKLKDEDSKEVLKQASPQNS